MQHSAPTTHFSTTYYKNTITPEFNALVVQAIQNNQPSNTCKRIHLTRPPTMSQHLETHTSTEYSRRQADQPKSNT